MKPTKELLFTYFAGQATSVQQKVIGEWLADAGNRETYFQWLDEWERSFPQYVPDVSHYLDLFRQRLDTPVSEQMPLVRQLPAEPRTLWQRGSWLVAASVSLLLLAGGWFARETILYNTITTGAHQLRSVSLPDGSTVALNSNSSLRVPRLGYGWLSRDVVLMGDAVFDIRHLANNQPFVVQAANGLAVEVLGTEFSVRSRAARAEVVLKRGKVNLHYATANQPPRNLLMKPGDRVTLDEKGALQLQTRADTTRFAHWRYRLFSFNDTSLREVASQIQTVFGVTVQLSDPALARRTLTGTIRAGSSDELADALAELLNLRVSHRDQSIIFSTPSETQLNQ
ncbi:FecR family protein [Spirosoma linguale]|uniref:Anti-FecI sigma factor, FecR n=1 Tax=Spirosoma linguale (strain ATCC 33905 / DSM 74 / LMG 10896 / Claus 1) TaxID=504472 RepID=D2QBJ5_SPILD|nr:anti-FecI sigma factor, FecR [Spirosoma linguale DSM 74]